MVGSSSPRRILAATDTTQFNDDYLGILADTLHRRRDIFMAHLNCMIYMIKLMTGKCWS